MLIHQLHHWTVSANEAELIFVDGKHRWEVSTKRLARLKCLHFSTKPFKIIPGDSFEITASETYSKSHQVASWKRQQTSQTKSLLIPAAVCDEKHFPEFSFKVLWLGCVQGWCHKTFSTLRLIYVTSEQVFLSVFENSISIDVTVDRLRPKKPRKAGKSLVELCMNKSRIDS